METLKNIRGGDVFFPPLADIRLPEATSNRRHLALRLRSCGAPAEVHACADARVRIPQVEGTRSLNIAVAAAIGLAEALRQTAWGR